MEENKLGSVNTVKNLWHIFSLLFYCLINCEAYGRSVLRTKFVPHLY
jgi:hypothetical protein